jgi:glutamine amidotransferase
MCIAIAQSKGSNSLTIEELERGWDTNPDGGGYAYINDDGTIDSVYSMDKDTFILQYLESHATFGASSPFMVHMRIATHGSISLNNCHPFEIELDGDGEMMFMHNGIINKVTNDIEGTDLTDTQGLATFVLADFHDGWLDNPHLVDYIEEFIDYSKLVFLTTSPELEDNLYILNQQDGLWVDDIWYSNYSCFDYGKPKSSKVLYNNGWLDNSNDETPFGSQTWGYYRNGEYIEGSQHPKANDTSFGRWLRDEDERRYDARELRQATHEDHIEMLNESIIRGDTCPVCTGISSCLCDDVCGGCYEYYHSCDCYGPFMSLTESFGQQWGERIVAIANGSDVTDDDDDEPERCLMCGDMDCPDADDAYNSCDRLAIF